MAALPDYVTDANAVLKDDIPSWRYGRAPDYTKARQEWEKNKKSNHKSGSLPDLVEKLVKNWEVEASHKTDIKDWRTIDASKYTLSVNGGPPTKGAETIERGTYNVLIASNEYYCPAHSSFDSTHKTFKRMMPTFSWEVLEVYAGPPEVVFRWRHWGTFKESYVGWNNKGDKVMVPPHGDTIDIEGLAVAKVNDKLQLEKVDIWFDPTAMFRQMDPTGEGKKELV